MPTYASSAQYTSLSTTRSPRYVILHTIFAVFHAVTFLAGITVKLAQNITAPTQLYLIRQERNATSPVVEHIGSTDPVWFLVAVALVLPCEV